MSREIGKSSAAFPFWEGTRAGRWSTVQVQRYEHSGLARITPRVKGHRKSREACAAVPAAEETQLSFSKRTQGLSPRYLQSLALRLKPHPDTNRSRWRVFQQPREAVHVQNGDAAPRLGRLRPSLARPDEAVTEPRTPLRGLGRLPALPGLTRLLQNCAVLRESRQTSHFTRRSAFGCVPGCDCSVPTALGFGIFVPPSSEHREFPNSSL